MSQILKLGKKSIWKFLKPSLSCLKMKCLGLIIKEEKVLTKGVSISERDMIEKINRCPDYKGTATNYPLSTELKRAVPEFLYPWLYKSNLFYLEVAFKLV